MGKEINRTVSLALVCGGLGLATATWVARGEADRTQLEDTGERLRSLREMHRRHLVDAANRLLLGTVALSKEELIRDVIASGQNGVPRGDVSTLRAAAPPLGALEGLVLDVDGKILAGTPAHGDVAVGALRTGIEGVLSGELPIPALADFAPYAPRNGAPRAFTIAPVFAGDVSVPRLESGGPSPIGFLALEVSTDLFNYMLTGDGSWRSEGLGDSGEVYLVGSDLLMRTESRFLSEASRTEYASDLALSGLDAGTIEEILTSGSSILLQRVDTDAVTRALAGESDTQLINDYRGVPVLSSFAGLKLGGTRFALISEMDVEEIRRASSRIAKDIVLPALLLLTLIGLGAYSVGRRRTARWRRLRMRTFDLAVQAGSSVVPPVAVDDEVYSIRSAISELETALIGVGQRANFLRAVFDADPAAVFVCSYPKAATRDGRDDPRILDATAAALGLTGYSRRELERLRLSDVLRGRTSEENDDPGQWLDDLRDEGAVERAQIEIIDETRERVPATLEGSVCTEGEEDNWFLVLVARLDSASKEPSHGDSGAP